MLGREEGDESECLAKVQEFPHIFAKTGLEFVTTSTEQHLLRST
jgi:hypothetical protein